MFEFRNCIGHGKNPPCVDLPFGFRPPHLKAPQTLALPFQTREVVTLVVAVEVTVDVLVLAELVGELVCVVDGTFESGSA